MMESSSPQTVPAGTISPEPISNSIRNADATANVDYYQVLGISRAATDQQIGAAYKGMILKYHPDRNPGDEESLRLYKLCSEAYAVLIDPQKRRLYDVGGIKAVQQADGTGGGGALGGIGRVFGSVMSKLGGANTQQQQQGSTQAATAPALAVSAEFIDIAQRICRSGGLDGETIVVPASVNEQSNLAAANTQAGAGAPPASAAPAVNATNSVYAADLLWATEVNHKVERHNGVYYRIIVEKAHVASGFALSIKSNNRDKFKVVLFDNDGGVVYQDECVKSLDGKSTQIRFYFTKFPAYQYFPQLEQSSSSQAQANPAATTTTTTTPATASSGSNFGVIDTAVNTQLARLDGFQPANKEIKEGRYLLGIYGDNSFIGKTSFSCLLVPASNDSEAVRM
jgi:curved DNA-binding protein CbpA